MMNSRSKEETPDSAPPRHAVRLPGFITDESVGLGDLVKRVTYLAGVKPCGGCERRAAALNRWMAFGPRK
jgi:hypothetical protein